jgi:predicted PurR-regulated permease PerM
VLFTSHPTHPVYPVKINLFSQNQHYMALMGDQKVESDSSSKRAAVPWYYHPFFKYAIGTLLVLTIIWVFYQVAFFLTPVIDFISTLFVPIVISLLFYYLFRPIVYFFETWRIPRVVTIIFIYLFIALFLVIFFAYLGPILTKQASALANTSVAAWAKVKESSQSFLLHFFNVNVNLSNELEQRLFTLAQQVTAALSKNLLDFLAFVTRVATILVVIPFIVFYLLKDDHDFASGFLRHVPEDFGREVRKILRNMDTTLANYITGVVLVSSSLGVLLFVGYLIILALTMHSAFRLSQLF